MTTTDCLVLRIHFQQHLFYIYFDDYDKAFVVRGKIKDTILCSYNITCADYVVNFLKVFYEDALRIRVDVMNYKQLPYRSEDIYFDQMDEYDGYLMKTVELRDHIIPYDQAITTISDQLYQYVRICENTYNNVYLDKNKELS